LISGRDPLGGFYLSGGKAYRFIKREAWPSFEASLPLQEKLAERGLWLPLCLPPAKEDESSYHCEVPLLPLVLYPYEWPFPLWKEAALTTLTIQQEALREGFWLRDATPFNLTLYYGRMCHFDQLSLEPYPEGSPWPAYVEFIRTFLAPLLLMRYKDRRLGKLIQLYPEGLLLDLVWELLPMRGRWSGLGLLHLSPHKLPCLSASLGGRGGLSMKKLLTLGECQANIDKLLSLPESAQVQVRITTPEGQTQEIPLRAAAYDVCGVILRLQKEYPKAKEAFEKALQIAPDFLLAKGNLYQFYAKSF
jgi:tetratricopeptide (TPR) repeat protein